MLEGSEVRRQAAGLAIALAVLLVVVVSLDLSGRAARRVLPGHRVAAVRGPAEVLAAWRHAGVRGRTLLWLDRELPILQPREGDVAAYLGGPAESAIVNDDNFLYLAMRENLVRRVVYVVPDERWDGYAQAAGERPEYHRQGDGLLQFVAGVPVASLPARRALAPTGERPLVYATARTREFFGAALTDRIAGDPALSDLVVIREPEGKP